MNFKADSYPTRIFWCLFWQGYKKGSGQSRTAWNTIVGTALYVLLESGVLETLMASLTASLFTPWCLSMSWLEAILSTRTREDVIARYVGSIEELWGQTFVSGPTWWFLNLVTPECLPLLSTTRKFCVRSPMSKSSELFSTSYNCANVHANALMFSWMTFFSWILGQCGTICLVMSVVQNWQ